MTSMFSPLLAEGALRTTFEWGRIQSNTDWILPIGVCILILLFVRYMYRRDAAELHPLWGWFLVVLRTAAFLALLIVYLQPHWRTEREEVRNSRALVLVDTSLSMGLSAGENASAAPASRTQDNGVKPKLNSKDAAAKAAATPKDPSPPPRPPVAGLSVTRAQDIAKALRESDFLSRLRKIHDVSVYQFAEDLRQDRVVTLGKLPPAGPDGTAGSGSEANPAPRPSTATVPPPDWAKLIAPTGVETRLGQALRQLIQQERGTPVSGIIVISDGGQNAGISPQSAVELAEEAKIPVFTVGVGSDKPPTNVAVSDLLVPPRAYPGDHYTLTGYLQAHGMVGRSVTVQILSRVADEGADAARRNPANPGQVVESRQVTLGGDGEVLPVKFELVPDRPGRRTLTLRVETPADDQNSADNSREADIEIVDRKNHVLLLADGPMREYQFLRNQLYRDHYTTVDVLLQSGRPGMSQEAKKILDDFPATREEMFSYDCVVAFDPNWQELKPSQMELLEKWVGEQGGGLIVIAGPINACKGPGGWVQDPALQTIRNLYPVEFPGRLATTESNMYAGREASPLSFTREGAQADFLWLGDTATASRQAWERFPGVFSYCPLKGPKPAAAVYARFSESGSEGAQQPVYMAGQFYGAGSVFYLGSGEMWRLRSVDDAYFEQFYTKLIRHVSQGRLLRGSTRGVLLVGQDRYLLGNSVDVRAQLTDARLEPLNRPSVNLQVVRPDGVVQTVPLRADPSRIGAFAGQFPALLEGTYRIELPIPESDNEHLSRRIQVRAPDLERENPRRNDALLSDIAKGTGGKYYIGMPSAVSLQGTDPLTEQLKDRTNTVILPVAPNPQWEEMWLRWIMVALCGLLCLEWLVRRLLKLA